ncbi:MAG TPA: alpha/beta hydrolase [Patescibacteria group bacterium]|nr:alpha/beta hydrolase [Patescibacteria group bacterium]
MLPTYSNSKRALLALCLLAVVAFAGLLTSCVSVGVVLINIPASVKGGYTIQHANYGRGPANAVDIYVPDPKNTNTRRDAVMFFYGGRWESGQISDFKFVGAALARRGYVVAIPEYRHYPAVRFPDFVEDGARAVAWWDDHAGEFGARRGVHLAGHSAGAHIAALIAADERYLAAQGKDTRKVVRDFAGLAGPYDFTPDEKDLIDIFGPAANYPQMQVTTFIDGREPPMLLQYGLDDKTVGAANHEKLAGRIREKGGRVKVITYPGIGHVGMVAAISGIGPEKPVLDDMVAFFRLHEKRQLRRDHGGATLTP